MNNGNTIVMNRLYGYLTNPWVEDIGKAKDVELWASVIWLGVFVLSLGLYIMSVLHVEIVFFTVAAYIVLESAHLSRCLYDYDRISELLV